MRRSLHELASASRVRFSIPFQSADLSSSSSVDFVSGVTSRRISSSVGRSSKKADDDPPGVLPGSGASRASKSSGKPTGMIRLGASGREFDHILYATGRDDTMKKPEQD